MHFFRKANQGDRAADGAANDAANDAAKPTLAASIHVDARAHTIRIHDDMTGTRIELGALRTAVVTAMGVIGRALSVAAHERDLSPIGDAIVAALQRCAGPLRDRALEAAIAEIHPTPLLYSAPFLDARWLWADAFRFRACRIAIAHAEDLVIDEDAPQTAIDVVTRLNKWRELFACPGTGKKAVNAALNDFGETMPATALWGLRNVVLRRSRETQKPLEILGWLGSLHDTPPAVIALAEGVSDDELCAQLKPANAATRTPRELAVLLAHADAEGCGTFLQLLRAAEQANAPDATAFARPPIPLPTNRGLRFIDNAAALAAEGSTMHHCVASLRSLCRRGISYIFHAEREGTHGTIHVSHTGAVVEARGPFNRASPAASWGAEVLASWGVGLWASVAPPDALTWPPGLPCPPGGRPLRSMRSLSQAFADIVERTQPSNAQRVALASWFRRAAREAIRGERGVFMVPGDNTRAWSVTFFSDPESHEAEQERDRLERERAQRRHRRDEAVRLEALRLHQVPALAADLGYVPRAPADMAQPRITPIPAPRFMGLNLLAQVDVAPMMQALRVQQFPDAARIYFSIHEDTHAERGVAALLEVDELGTVRVVASRLSEERNELWRSRLVAWAAGFWGPRLGMQRSTWKEQRAPSLTHLPAAAEPLRTVEACHIVYTSTVERRGDADLALARFYVRHVEAAMRGQAWLVARDRSAGSVVVVDARRQIIARTDDLFDADGSGTGRAMATARD